MPITWAIYDYYGLLRGLELRFWAFSAAFTVFLILALTVKAEIDFHYRRHSEMDDLEISLRALKGLWRFKWTIPSLKWQWEKNPQIILESQAQTAPDSLQKERIIVQPRYLRLGFIRRIFPQIPAMLAELRQVKTRFYRSIQCTALELKIEIGCADPVHTAIAAGALWSFLGMSGARLCRQVTVKVKKPILIIIPQFQKIGFSCDFHCIFKARIGHIIFAGLNLMRIFIPGRRR